MRTRVVRSVALAAVVAWPVIIEAQGQTPMAPSAADMAAPNYLPIGPPPNLPPSKPADLSGDWAMIFGEFGQSLSAADPGGRMRGKEPDIP